MHIGNFGSVSTKNLCVSRRYASLYVGRTLFIFSTYGLYFLPGSNFAPFEEVKALVSNSAEFFPKSAPWRIWEDLGGFGSSNDRPGKYNLNGNIRGPVKTVRRRGSLEGYFMVSRNFFSERDLHLFVSR